MLYLFLMLALAQSDDYPAEIAVLMKSKNTGCLSSLHHRTEYPFGSLMPYALDSSGKPLFFISNLAVHTKNIKKNNKISIMVFAPDKDGDIFNGPRVTLSGKAVKIDQKEIEEAKKVYLKAHPNAENWIDFEDFAFYRLEIEKIYYVGGFGIIEKVTFDEYKDKFK
jgi:hypothetical protein